MGRYSQDLCNINRALIDRITEAKRAEGGSNDGQQDAGASKGKTEAMSPRSGMVGPGAGSAASEGADATYSFSDARPSGAVTWGGAAAPAGYGDLRAFDRAPRGQHKRTVLGSGRFGTKASLGASRPGQGAQGPLPCPSTTRR